MAYTIIEQIPGIMPITSTDSGVLSPLETSSGGTTYYPTSPMTPGMIVRAADPTYGVGEFILLLGVANLAVGSPVVYNSVTYTTALAPVGTNKPQPVAISMSANTSATTWSWFQISGMAVAKKTSALALASGAAVGILTAGLVAATGTGKEIEGALTAAKATTPKTVTLIINRPCMQGRVT